VGRIALVLAVDHGGHALHGFHDLFTGHDAVTQPVGHVLAGNAQRGAVFHEPHVVDVGHLRAAHALVDPAHHIAQYALRIVVEFLLDLFGRPVGVGGHGHFEDAAQQGLVAALHRGLDRLHVDL